LIHWQRSRPALLLLRRMIEFPSGNTRHVAILPCLYAGPPPRSPGLYSVPPSLPRLRRCMRVPGMRAKACLSNFGEFYCLCPPFPQQRLNRTETRGPDIYGRLVVLLTLDAKQRTRGRFGGSPYTPSQRSPRRCQDCLSSRTPSPLVSCPFFHHHPQIT